VTMNITSRYILSTIVLAMAPFAGVMAQDIATIAKSDPLIITGAIGTQNTYYHSTSGVGYASPFSTSFYASMNISCYGISMPFSFYYSGDNTSFSYPQFSFNISPTYKDWTLHIGQRSMTFSSYVYTLPFNGVGLEYNRRGKASMRFGAFYGTLKRAVNADPEDISARTPQYRRTGWGVKAGYGTSSSYIDVYLFRAKDHQSSIDEVWYDQLNAQENLVLGVKGALRLGSHFNLSANFANSILTTNLLFDEVDPEAVSKVDNIFNVRYSTVSRWAGDASLNTNWRYFNASISYKRLNPDYNSLGVSYLTSNYHSLSATASTHIKRIGISASFSGQEDNLSGGQLYTNHAYVYSGTLSIPITNKLNLSASYNGYAQSQTDGTVQVNDSTRVSRMMDSWSLSSSYGWMASSTDHSFNLSGNYTRNRDLNPYATGDEDVNTLAIGAGYSLTILPIETSFSLNANHQESDGYGMKYQTDIYSFTSSKSFLKERQLNASLTLSLTDNKVQDHSRNISLGGQVSLGYTLLKAHSFSLSGSFNRYASTNLVNQENQEGESTSDIYCTFSYNYTFSLLHIRRKAEEGKKRVTSDFVSSVRREAQRSNQRIVQQKQQSKNQPPKRY